MPRRIAKRLLIAWAPLLIIACTHQEARKPMNQSVSSKTENSVVKNRAQLALETEVLENWLTQQNIPFTQTPYGVWYSYTNVDKPHRYVDSTSSPVLYLNLLKLDGTPYYEGKRIDNPLSNQSIPTGILRVMQEIPIGVEATVAMPSLIAYGATGDGLLIPPNTPLIARIFITLGSQKNNP